MAVTLEATAARLTRDEAKILAHYAAGESVDEVAASTGVPRGDIALAIDALARNNRNLAQNLAMAWQRANPASANGRPPPAPPAPAQTVAAIQKATDTIADLITRAVASEVPRLVRLADKIQDEVDQLEEQLEEHERGRALRSEAEQLEARLNEIKQQLGVKRAASTAAAPTGVRRTDNKAIREWAAANGIDCPGRGRIPAAVVARYEEATR